MERITRSIFATDEAEYRLHQSEYRLPTIADPVGGQSTNRAATQDIFVYEDKRPCYERLWFLSSGSPCPLGLYHPDEIMDHNALDHVLSYLVRSRSSVCG
jgi:hypothetical protein